MGPQKLLAYCKSCPGTEEEVRGCYDLGLECPPKPHGTMGGAFWDLECVTLELIDGVMLGRRTLRLRL